MKKDSPQNHEDELDGWDGLLDKVSNQLRSEPVPEMPVELLAPAESLSKHEKQNRHGWAASISCLAVAIAVVCWIGIKFNQGQGEGRSVSQNSGVLSNTTISVQQVKLDTLRPFDSLESEIRQMESELNELKREAKYLDVYRKMNSISRKNAAKE